MFPLVFRVKVLRLFGELKQLFFHIYRNMSLNWFFPHFHQLILRAARFHLNSNIIDPFFQLFCCAFCWKWNNIKSIFYLRDSIQLGMFGMFYKLHFSCSTFSTIHPLRITWEMVRIVCLTGSIQDYHVQLCSPSERARAGVWAEDKDFSNNWTRQNI